MLPTYDVTCALSSTEKKTAIRHHIRDDTKTELVLKLLIHQIDAQTIHKKTQHESLVFEVVLQWLNPQYAVQVPSLVTKEI